MKAIITCAGFATRLWPLTRDVPKPLLEVRNKAIVGHIIDRIAELPDVDVIYIVTNAKFAPAFEAWLRAHSFVRPVELVNDGTAADEDRLGQIGDVQFVIREKQIDDDLIIAAGDNLFNFSLEGAHTVFKKHRGVVNPLYDVGSPAVARQLGTVVLDERSLFAEFQEKHPQPKSTLASLGIYFFPREKLSRITEYLEAGKSKDKMGHFISWLMENEPVAGHVYTEKWFDIGWIESLEVARREFEPGAGAA